MTVLNPKMPMMDNKISSNKTPSQVWIHSRRFNKMTARLLSNRIQMSKLVCIWKIIWLCVESRLKVMTGNFSWTLRVRSLTWMGSLSELQMPTNLRSYKKTHSKINNSSNNKTMSWTTAWRWVAIRFNMPREISTTCKINTRTICSRIIKRKWCSWTMMKMINQIKIMLSMMETMAKITNKYD